MILELALLQAAPVLGAIGPQPLPASGCAAYLWQTGPTPQLVAAAAQDGALALSVDGRPMELTRTAARGDVRSGLPASSDYAAGDVKATLELDVAITDDLSDGARVPAGTLSVARTGGDALVVSVAGLVGCVRAVATSATP